MKYPEQIVIFYRNEKDHGKWYHMKSSSLPVLTQFAYDNLMRAITQISEGKDRKLNKWFKALRA